MANEILAENIAFDENGLYIPQTWLDGVGEENFTPMTADRMNHIEQGIKGLSDAWDSQSQLSVLKTVTDLKIRTYHGGIAFEFMLFDGTHRQVCFYHEGVRLLDVSENGAHTILWTR